MRINGSTHGYTMVEMLVVMVILAVVMTIITATFAGMVRNSGQLIKSAETDIGGLIGLELMRSDLERAGFGLPWSMSEPLVYSEAHDDLKLVNSCPDGCPDAEPADYDDRTYVRDRYVPRAYRFGNNVGYNGSDYLVLKGSALAGTDVARTWAFLSYNSIIKYPPSDEILRFSAKARAVVIRSGANSAGPVRELVTSDSTFYEKPSDPDKLVPQERWETYLVYGVADKNLTFPFNRADYYINRPDSGSISSSCARGTGVLYKTLITQGGNPDYYPILDCAADMQVVLFWDTDGDGDIDFHSGSSVEAPFDEVADGSAEFREQLKEIRVYILAQQGRVDRGYSYPVSSPDQAIVVGDPDLKVDGSVLGRVWKASELAATFGANWRNYHWKLYTIVVQPKNL